MLKYNFTRVFRAKAIERPYTFLVSNGISDYYATRVINNRAKRIDLNELEKLCIVLKCTPNDFLEWIPDNSTQVEDNHPLNDLRKYDNEADLIKTLNSLPLGKLKEIDKLIKSELMK